jgi:hypothetical protein
MDEQQYPDGYDDYMANLIDGSPSPSPPATLSPSPSPPATPLTPTGQGRQRDSAKSN